MKETKGKKEEWEDFLKHWHKLGHPVVPGRVSLEIYKKLIKKHVKGKKALLLGATWQIRDMLAKMGFHVTVVDISSIILNAHKHMCKVKKRDEEIVEGNWLEFESDMEYDLVIADAANFQIKESSYDLFFRKVASWLKPEGVSIQLLMGNYRNITVSLDETVDFIKKTDIKELKNHLNKAYYYLGYFNYKNKDRYGDIAAIYHELIPYVKKGVITQEKLDAFDLGIRKFMAVMLPKEQLEGYVKKYLDIVEKVPHGLTKVEEAFYWQYVMKPKQR